MKINQLIASLESAPVGDGDLLGKPFKALPYQRRFVRSAFKPGIIRAGLSLARGGEKSGLASALCLDAVRPEGVRNQAIKKAKAARSKAFHSAKAAYREDVKTAEATRDITIKNAGIARDKTAYPARLSYQRATKAYRAAYEKARGTLGDAYIRAYANPYGFRRKVSGYSREVVLKAAVHERVNHCPPILKKQPEPR